MVSAAIFTAAELDEHRNAYAAEEVTADGSHFVRWWRTSLRWSMPGVPKERVAEKFAVRMANPAISWWGHRAAFNYLTAEALPKVAQPILVLNPEDDLWTFTPRARGLLAHPESRIHNLPGWSHGFLDLKTTETAAIVRGFLDKP
jgi:pimeloyl-ACP methyl ester carboxylesterase